MTTFNDLVNSMFHIIWFIIVIIGSVNYMSTINTSLDLLLVVNIMLFMILLYIIYVFLKMIDSMNTYHGKETCDVYLLCQRVDDLEKVVYKKDTSSFPRPH